jgi:hypothetical protein
MICSVVVVRRFDNIYAECTDISNGYSHVNKHRNIDESSNYYDRTNHSLYLKQISTFGSTDHVYARVQQYGHYPVHGSPLAFLCVTLSLEDIFKELYILSL